MGVKKPKKVFEPGQAVEVQRDVGKPWEPAVYKRPVAMMRGWHKVRIPPDAPARYVSSADGYETTEDDLSAVRVYHVIVPTQRVRGVR